MALDLTPEQRTVGQGNFRRTSDELSRRGFMKVLLAGGAVAPIGAAAYFGYQYDRLHNNPVKAGLIGAGDEGGVLVGEHNPKYLEFIAYSDIRPYNQARIFKGEPTGPRKGFNHHYGNDAVKHIRLYDDYREMLQNKDIEAVVIALPLHLHAQAAIDAMRAGKHVLCEKLMAWNIEQCKEMIRVAEETDRILSIGHQRHYSLLYAQAAMAVRAGVLGDLKHIRALWHRNNSWPKLNSKGEPTGELRDGWSPEIRKEDEQALKDVIRSKWGYKDLKELVRWRLYQRTGGGLMAELGSHQLDACSIFLTANARRNYPGEGDDFKLMPLAVSGIGGKYFYTDDREAEDSVFVTFEFPGPTYYAVDKDGRSTRQVANKKDIVVVTYSSINTNAFESYGECLMGSRGTMVVEMEQKAMLFGERDPNLKESSDPRSTAVTVATVGAGQPVIDTTSTSGPALGKGGGGAGSGIGADAGPVSRGYREEMEDFAYCIRVRDQGSEKDRRQVRCHGRVAMADAIMALTSNRAMKRQERIEFRPEWFDPRHKDVPDPDMKPEIVT